MNKEKAHPIHKAIAGLIGGAILVTVLAAVTIIVGNLRLRVDLTEEKLYSLSDGTRQVLKKLDGPVTLNLFFNRSNPNIPMPLKNFAMQVEDLLEEYRIAAKGKVRVVKLDPKPDSDAEEWARKYGIAGQPVEMFGPPIYFGLVAVSGKSEGTLANLDPRTQQMLEYNITRMISNVATPSKPVLGVFSSLPVLGTPRSPYPMPGQPQGQDAWVAFRDLQQNYDVRPIRSLDTDSIDPAIGTLIVVHPKDLTPKAEYAIDQFVLGGGKVIMFVDPFSFADQAATPPQGYQMPRVSSDAPTLLKAWGVGYNSEKVLSDPSVATPMRTGDNRIERNPVVLTYGKDNVAADDILTAQLESVRAACTGILRDETSDDIEARSLIVSSDAAGTVDAMTARRGADAVRRQMMRTGTPQNIALLLKGTFTTAFPDGAPDESADDETEADGKPEAKPDSLSRGQSVVLIIADADMIFDPLCVEPLNFFGQQAYRPLNDNLAFFANAVESLSGSEDLIGIRSRGTFNRPFVEVDRREAEAVQRWQSKEADLVSKLREAQTQLAQLQAQKDEDQRFILSDQQKEAVAAFRREEFKISKELKQVRKNLRKDIEALGVVIKAINIALMPILVCMVGIGYGLRRRRA